MTRDLASQHRLPESLPARAPRIYPAPAPGQPPIRPDTFPPRGHFTPPTTTAGPHPRPHPPRRPRAAAENPGQLALGQRHRHRLGPPQRPRPGPLTTTTRALSRRPTPSRGQWNPRLPGPTAGPLSRPSPKIKITNAADFAHDASDQAA